MPSPAPLTLVVGDEELLVARAVTAVVRAARAANAEVDVRDVTGAELERGPMTSHGASSNATPRL